MRVCVCVYVYACMRVCVIACAIRVYGFNRFEVRFKPLTDNSKPLALRSVRAAEIGHLVSVKAICTRVSDVKPLVSVVTYACDVCGFEIYQNVSGALFGWLLVTATLLLMCGLPYDGLLLQVNAKSFLPLKECPSKACKDNKQTGRLHMQVRPRCVPCPVVVLLGVCVCHVQLCVCVSPLLLVGCGVCGRCLEVVESCSVGYGQAALTLPVEGCVPCVSCSRLVAPSS